MTREQFYLVGTNVIWILIVLNMWFWLGHRETITYSNVFVYKEFKKQTQTQSIVIRDGDRVGYSFDEKLYYFKDHAEMVNGNASQSIDIESEVGVSMNNNDLSVTHQIKKASTSTSVAIMKADPITEFFAWAWKMVNNFGVGFIAGLGTGLIVK